MNRERLNGEAGRILIVDDDPVDLQILAALLSGNGYKLSSFSNAEFDITSLKNEPPDCIILDINLPANNGIKLCSRIKSISYLADIPVIFVSDSDESEKITEAFNSGGVDYITKPFRTEEVLVRIRNHVTLSNMKRSLEDIVEERTSELKDINRRLQDSIDEYKMILKALQDNETLLLAIALNIPNSYLAIIEKDYTIGFAAGKEFKKAGIDPWRLIGLPVEKVFMEKSELVRKHFESSFAGFESSFELFFNNQYLYFKTVPLADSDGAVQRILTVAENITERKEAELHIRESLHEKETLLREIHHRVKNNMQLVSSLLTLQSGCTDNFELESIFRTLQSRIFSMSLVHEKLYHYKQFSKINFREYIKELIAEIHKSFCDEESGDDVAFDLNLDSEYLSIERAIPFGLILNELVMNSFKHAFSENRGSVVSINFLKNGDGGFTLSVRDNGSGLPDGFDITTSDSMGMVLLRELTNQIHGSLSVNCVDGTEFIIVAGPEKKEHDNRPVAGNLQDSKKVLIVEDERIISTMLRKIIEEQGYAVSGCVTSGKDAIHHALNFRPDLVIMDIMLEDEIDGVEAARIITGETEVPVIFLTGNSDSATIKAARDTGPFEMLTKPVRKNHLIEVIKSAIG